MQTICLRAWLVYINFLIDGSLWSGNNDHCHHNNTTTTTRRRRRRRRSWILAHASQVHSHSTWKCDKFFSGNLRLFAKETSPIAIPISWPLSESTRKVPALRNWRRGNNTTLQGKKKITWGKLLEIPENPLKAGTGNIFGGDWFLLTFHHHFFGLIICLEIMDVSIWRGCVSHGLKAQMFCVLFLCLGLGDFGVAEPGSWVGSKKGGFIQCWSQENRIHKKQLLGFITGSNAKKNGTQVRCTPKMCKDFSKKCAKDPSENGSKNGGRNVFKPFNVSSPIYSYASGWKIDPTYHHRGVR